MTKHKTAPRWVEFDFLGQVQTQNPERYRLKIDANLIHSWHVTRAEGEPDTSVCIVFVGLGNKELGCVMVDLIEYGLCFAPTINDLIYEARHPWLDVNDALKKKVFNVESALKLMLLRTDDGCYFTISESYLADKSIALYRAAFKPINPAWYCRFAHVEAWKG